MRASLSSSAASSRTHRPASVSRHRNVLVKAEVASKGRAFHHESLSVGRLIGDRSLYEGSVKMPQGIRMPVIVRKVPQDASDREREELLLSAYASKTYRAKAADFVGYCSVTEQDDTKLAPGLWMMWRWAGSKNLSYYLKKRECIRLLAEDLEVPEDQVVPTVMKQLLDSLAAFHEAGLQHRDVKPENLVYAAREKCFRLIDLGACADMRTSTELVPGLTLDSMYSPPEQDGVQSYSPAYIKSMLKVALTPTLLARHKPACLDAWSAGLVLVQLAIPTFRSDRGLRGFLSVYGPKFGYDLDAWRKSSVYIPRREFEVLDADDGAGWELLKALLRPREVITDDEGITTFKDVDNPRISVAEAVRHRFLGQAAQTGSWQPPPNKRTQSASSRLRGSTFLDIEMDGADGPRFKTLASASSKDYGQTIEAWSKLASRLSSVEKSIQTTANAAQNSTALIARLRMKAKSGSAGADERLAEEERLLRGNEEKLVDLHEEYNSLARDALSVCGILASRDPDVAATGMANRTSSERAIVKALELRQARAGLIKQQQQLLALEKDRLALSATFAATDDAEPEEEAEESASIAGSSGSSARARSSSSSGISGKPARSSAVGKLLDMFGVSSLEEEEEDDEDMEEEGSMRYKALTARLQKQLAAEEETVSSVLLESEDLKTLIAELEMDSEADVDSIETSRLKMAAQKEAQDQQILEVRKELELARSAAQKLDMLVQAERKERLNMEVEAVKLDNARTRAMELNQKALMEVMDLRELVTKLEVELMSGDAGRGVADELAFAAEDEGALADELSPPQHESEPAQPEPVEYSSSFPSPVRLASPSSTAPSSDSLQAKPRQAMKAEQATQMQASASKKEQASEEKAALLVAGFEPGLTGWAVEQQASRLQQLSEEERAKQGGMMGWALEQQEEVFTSLVESSNSSKAPRDAPDGVDEGSEVVVKRKRMSFWEFIKP